MPRTSSARSGLILGLTLSACLAGSARGATFTPRFGHSATLLASGDILLVGGAQSPSGLSALTTVQLWLEGRGTLLDMTPLLVARASHTATLLPNGRVLVTGGRTTTGASLSDGVVYDPLANTWTPVGGTMVDTRFNHTATLLKTGSVLLCGGQNSGGTMNASCYRYDPATNLFSAAGSLQAARSAHTATLLPDGRVYLAGGYNVPSQYLVTTEVYNPGSNSFASAQPLIQARAFHTATMLGNGKILIAGGFNGRNLKANVGLLDSTELYDPIADSIVPAQPMQVRRQGHAAILDPGGELALFGGLGNQTTSYVVPVSAVLETGSSVTGTPATIPVSNITGGTLNIPMDFSLSVKTSGVIQEGYVFFSSPSVNFGAGIAYFTPGNSDTLGGLRANLAGTTVFCDPDGTCGHIRKTVVPVGMAGTYSITPLTVNLDSLGGTVPFSGILELSGALTEVDSQRNIEANSSITGTTRITGLPAILIGADITAVNFVLSAGTLVQTSSFTATLNGGTTISIPPGTTIESDGAGGARTEPFTITISNLTGRVNWSGSTGQQFTDPIQWTAQYPPPQQSGLTGTLSFTASPIDLSNQTFVADAATVVIRGMVYGDEEVYKPQTNAWAFDNLGATPKFSYTATLTADGDIARFGGKSCGGATCSSLVPLGVGPITLAELPGWTAVSSALSTRRANHTATLLPDGRILAAGGSDGPNVERTAELFDPETRDFAPTGSMQDVRDLHTANLLPNGRVLVAGGFSTSATSTGSINGAEIYFPDTGVWIPTSVMASSRSNHTAVNLADGNVMVLGGYAGGIYLTSIEVYYSTAGVWRSLPPMPTGRARHTATLLQDRRIFVVGGVNSGGVLSSASLYDPATGVWSAAASLASGAAVHSHTATLLPDGRVLVAGGNDGFGEVSLSQIYDPRANSWQVTDNPLSAGRFNHTATLLPNGIVLVAGGAQGGNNMIDGVETFDVGASSWTSAGKLSGLRGYHTTTLARDGFLYALGGQSGPNAFLTSADSVYFAHTPDASSAGFPPSVRKSSITAVDRALFDRGELLTMTGANLHGATEASGGGAGSANSSHSGPRVILQAVDGSGGSSSQGNGGYILDLTTRIYVSGANPVWSLVATSITVSLPANAAPAGPSLPYGWYHLREGSNAQYSDSILVQAGPAKPASAASAVASSILGTSSVSWTWNAAAGGYDGYNLYASSNGVWITTRPASASSFTQTGLGPNTTVQLMLAPYTLSGDGPLAASGTSYTLAAPPSALAISSVTGTFLTLSWDTSGNAQGTLYEVSQSTDAFVSSFSTPVPTGLALTANTVLISPLEDGVSYSFRVRAFNGTGIPSGFSATASTTTRSTLSGLQGIAQSTTKIRWSWVSGGGVLFYKLYNSTSGAVIAAPSSNQYDDDSLGTNTARSVMVSAVSSAGEGPLTDGVTAYTLAAVPTPGVPPIVGITTGSLTGSWQANGNPLGTMYGVSVASGGVGASTSTFTSGFSASAAGLFPAEVYDVMVVARNGDGLLTSFVVLGSTPTLPLPPTNLRVTGTTPSSIGVVWEKGANVSSATYAVSYTTASLPAPTTAFVSLIPFSQNFKGTSASLTGLMTSTTYTISVQARNTAGAASAPVSVTTLTFNGGVPLGSVGGTASADQNNFLAGSLGNGRNVSLRAPSSAFPSDVFLMISSFNAAGANSKCPGGLDIGIEILSTPALQPARPLFLTVSYAAGELGAVPASQATFFRFDPIGGRCVPLQTTLDAVNLTITAQLNHLSQFQVAAMTAAANPDEARVFPNPFYAGRDGYVTIDQAPAGARVRVFTLRGEMLLDQQAGATGMLTWGGTNRGGRPVASGVYLVSIESGGMKKILKLAVVR